jgi:hypothetical protein
MEVYQASSDEDESLLDEVRALVQAVEAGSEGDEEERCRNTKTQRAKQQHLSCPLLTSSSLSS